MKFGVTKERLTLNSIGKNFIWFFDWDFTPDSVFSLPPRPCVSSPSEFYLTLIPVDKSGCLQFVFH